jgi:hypothetical protein
MPSVTVQPAGHALAAISEKPVTTGQENESHEIFEIPFAQ